MTNNHKNPRISFRHFLEKFPEIELPITLGDEAINIFSKENDPLPGLMIEQHLLPIEEKEPDALTEYVPCFQIPETHTFHAVVYWRGSLMNYQYILATFNPKGELLDRQVIAGTYSDGKTVISSVATIDPDWIIFIVSGQSEGQEEKLDYDPTKSKANNLELLADGRIVNSQ